jgi:hypothetical protein
MEVAHPHRLVEEVLVERASARQRLSSSGESGSALAAHGDDESEGNEQRGTPRGIGSHTPYSTPPRRGSGNPRAKAGKIPVELRRTADGVSLPPWP